MREGGSETMAEEILVVDDEKEIADLVALYLKMRIIRFINTIQQRKPLPVSKGKRSIWLYWILCFPV